MSFFRICVVTGNPDQGETIYGRADYWFFTRGRGAVSALAPHQAGFAGVKGYSGALYYQRRKEWVT